jgi:hypothetical protein
MTELQSLPQIKPVTVKQYTLGGYELRFRKAKVKDFEFFNELLSEKVSYIDMTIKLLARLLEGYTETEQEKIDFLYSIDGDTKDVEVMKTILIDCGIYNEEKKKDLTATDQVVTAQL